ncbi:two-component sensor histidine kinase, partial [Bacillus sp. MM2020_4]|nr:two-component sensor histidine kinase [Bacillus sp. MM2020_4]
MKEGTTSPKLIYEETKAIKLFLSLYYILLIGYDVFWYYILPIYTKFGRDRFPSDGLGIWLYIFNGCLLPISIYFIKKG